MVHAVHVGASSLATLFCIEALGIAVMMSLIKLLRILLDHFCLPVFHCRLVSVVA
jgi:hypothetical protein